MQTIWTHWIWTQPWYKQHGIGISYIAIYCHNRWGGTLECSQHFPATRGSSKSQKHMRPSAVQTIVMCSHDAWAHCTKPVLIDDDMGLYMTILSNIQGIIVWDYMGLYRIILPDVDETIINSYIKLGPRLTAARDSNAARRRDLFFFLRNTLCRTHCAECVRFFFACARGHAIG